MKKTWGKIEKKYQDLVYLAVKSEREKYRVKSTKSKKSKKLCMKYSYNINIYYLENQKEIK